MSESQWEPSRDGLRYVVERRVYSNFAGSGYVYARDNGRVLRYWTRRAAQQAADVLNQRWSPRDER